MANKTKYKPKNTTHFKRYYVNVIKPKLGANMMEHIDQWTATGTSTVNGATIMWIIALISASWHPQ